MTDEIRDPELERLRDGWEPPGPRLDLHGRMLTAYDGEFGAAGIRRRLLSTQVRLVAIASAILLAALVGMLVVGGRKTSATLTDVTPPTVPSAEQRVPAGASVQPARPAGLRNSHRAHLATRTSEEVVTQFFPLMAAPPPLGRGALLRATVPGTMLRAVGLWVDDDRLDDSVQADILIGEEGLPRAIRFVGIHH
jgi:hypothetical protein